MTKKTSETQVSIRDHWGNVIINNPPQFKQSLAEFVTNLPMNTSKSQGLFAQLRFDTCSAGFYGRKQEMAILDDFLDDKSALLWWAITGAAGRGKTRLAYEYVNQVNRCETWVARFINWPVLQNLLLANEFVPKQSDKNLLLVFDYVYAYQNSIAKWVEQLNSYYNSKSKIRILLIEREDKKIDSSGTMVIAPWEEMFCSASHSPLLMRQLKYRNDNINLNRSALSKKDCCDIVTSYCKNTNRSLTSSQIDYIVNTAFISGKKNITPLPQLLLTEFHLSKTSSATSTNPLVSALEDIVTRELQILYQTLQIDTHIHISIFNRILHLTTVVGKTSMSDPLLLSYASNKNALQHTENVIEKLINSPLCIPEIDDNYTISAIQPDLIGEYYVYTRFRNMSDKHLKDFLDVVNSTHPTELGRFLLRYIEDCRLYRFDEQRIAIYSKYLPANESTFVVLDESGNEVRCEVLFTFDSEETGKAYIVYTDNTVDDENNTRVYASIFDPNDRDSQLLPIETEREWNVIETILETIQEETTKGHNIDESLITNKINERLCTIKDNASILLEKITDLFK